MKNFLLLLSFWLSVTTAYATRYYVKTNGNDNNTGQSWNTAFATLQKALETTPGNNDEIWVAGGTYYPTANPTGNGNDRYKTFKMKNGVAIYGGFDGTETTLTDRASALIHTVNKTVLSGDVDLDGILDDENVYQVIRNLAVNSTAQLDGFTISDGKATGSNTYHFGGGMYNGGSSPTIANCRFTNNRADSGGGMYNVGSSPLITNCSFTENYANDGGAGMYSNNSSSPIITDCIFSKNTSTNSGGGIEFFVTTPTLIRCIFSGNSAAYGAGMMNRNSPSIVTNCSFLGNKATDQGGGAFIEYSSPVFTNCSMSGNQAVTGGGMYINASTTNAITMRNCILWGNNTEIYPTASGGSITYTFTHTIVKGMNNGSGIFDGTQDPNFIAQPDQYAVPTTVGNMQLAICSPARNAGDNTVFTAGQTPDLSAITTDLAGNSRIFNTTVDLGAYEMQSVGTTLYVKSDGDDSNDGLSWGTAVKTLQKALDFVCRDKQIWVAAGTYYPTEGSGRDKTFKMKGWVTIYGGFAGTETTLADRVSSLIHTTNKTTLSGDVDEDGLLDAENVYHVIHNRAIGHNAQIDGFTISDGYANGIATGHYGGGMLNINSSPTVTNCRFTNNRGDYGGGMCNRANSSPTITNCSFIGNFGGDGGGLYDLQSPSYIITDCLFSNNTATSGGGMYITGATHTLISCVFSGNTATNQGAGVMAVSSASLFTNCSFLGNKANNQGGGFYNFKANPVFANCSFSGNKALRGGGIDAYEGLTSAINLRNCIVWGNDPEIHPTTSGGNVTYTFTNTIVKGMNNGSGVLDGTQDPLFVSQPDYNAAPTTIGNLQLQYCSPAVDVGNTAVFNAGQTPDLSTITTDLAGNSRIFNNTVDLGAYERQLDNSLTINTTLSNPTTCGGTNGNITISGLLINTSYSVTYTKDAASPQTLSRTSDNGGLITLENLTAGSYTIIATYGSCVSNAANVTLNDPEKPTVVLGVIPAVCLGTTGVSLPFSDLTASPDQYSLDYNSVANAAGFPDIFQSALSASPLGLTIPLSASGATYTAALTVRNSTTGCSSLPQSIVISINTKPTITLSINGQTFNEGNIQTLCDTDANSVNSLQLTINNSCVAGPVLWRSQAGAGAWSDWSTIAPSSQPSSNTVYQYQAACDASCPSTYTNPIALTVNYRAAVPHHVSLVADGTTVAEGQSATICNLVGNALIFNATCAAGEVLRYSVDGGDYTTVVPFQIIDNNFHNYRVRCRKADNTPSCVETESAVISLKITTPAAAPTVSITPTSNCGTPTAFAGNSSCGSLTTVWYNATTNQALPSLPTTTPNETTSYYARCLAEAGCLSEKSNVVTFTLTPVNDAPLVTVSAELVCAGTEVTVSTTCPAGTTALWNTGITEASFKVAFSNVTKASYTAKCVAANGCQSPVSAAKTVFWKGFDLTFINVGESKSAVKTNDKAAWASQFITPDAGPELDYSTEANPTIYFSENVNKTAPRFWTIHAETCNLGTDGSLTFNLLATPELGVIRSYNTHENNAPYFMYANREGFTELYAQNHPAYGFFADNGNGGNVYDDGLPKGLYKLGVRYWDQKGQGSIYPSTRQPAGNVLAYQEYWFRIQSKNGIGTGSARIATDNGQRITDNGTFAQVMPNPVSNTLHLKVNEAKGQKVSVNLLDASGRTLQQRAFVPQTDQHQEAFEVSQLANGMYFLKVNTADKQTTLKVLKVN